MLNSLSQADRELVNNAYYDTEACEWSAPTGPLALLKAENELKNQWVLELLVEFNSKGVLSHIKPEDHSFLDIGCGGGFLCNQLASHGFKVTGVDLSQPSLSQARAMDQTQSVNYQRADAYKLPFKDFSFTVVSCLDFLEHVSKPAIVIQEARRVLKPGGLFIYHTFNRNPASYLIALKGVEWFVKGTPKKLHSYELFIKPKELNAYLKENSLQSIEERGLRPILNRQFWTLLTTRKITQGFRFTWSRSKLISYMGVAQKAYEKLTKT